MHLPFGSGGVARLARDRRGASAVEFALIAPVLLLLTAGLIDGSRLIVQTMQVKAAAQAGADFALRNGWNLAGIEAAVAGATPLNLTAEPVPQKTTACVAGGAIVASAGPNCPNGGHVGTFVTVWAEKPFAPLMPWPGVPLPNELSAQAQVRIP